MHWEFTQLALAFGKLQARPHPPQFCGLFVVLTSHPSTGLLLQSAKPGLHTRFVHIPPWQKLLQHSAFPKHVPPFGVHGGWHCPALHTPLQQSEWVVQNPAVGWQQADWQVPAMQFELQQSLSTVQDEPEGAQPARHAPESFTVL